MKKKTRKLVTRILLLCAALAVVAAIIISKTNKPPERNFIVNPGFEEGDLAWQWLAWSKGWAPFKISGKKSRSGTSSAHLDVRSKGETRSTIVWGVVQEITLSTGAPDCLEGYYFVDSWERGALKQYIQVVIIDLSKKHRAGNAQMRYIISGVDKPPYNLSNAHYVFVDPEKKTTPEKKRWVRFTINPASDFKRFWNYIPPAGHRLRLLFEARFDGKKPGSPDVKTGVYYDDLYLGPAASGHCD